MNSRPMEKDTVIVSVCLITYNHEKFIAKAIEGVIAQKVNFKFNLVIGEDCSKDSTRKICEQYAAQYPEIIKLLPSDKNHGPIPNEVRTLRACTGKYIALCEGDDYWTDPNKLQKQIDFLEANEAFTMCFSDVGIIDEIGVERPDVYPPLHKQEFSLEDIVTAGYCFIPTATLVFRNILPGALPSFYLDAISGDIALHIMLADKGKAKYLPEKTAVYRHHAGGITKTEDVIQNGDYKEFQLYAGANEYYGYKYDDIFRKRLLEMAKVMLIYGARNKKGIKKWKHYFKKMPHYMKYSKGINFREFFYYHAVLFAPFLLKFSKKPAK